MNQLVFRKNDQILTTSRNIARDFNKNHQHVLRDIDNLRGGVQNWTDLFYETTYVHEQNKQEYREYLMTRDGFTLLAMGFTGSRAMQFKMDYIREFNKMEQFLNSPEMIVQRALEIQQQKVHQLENKIQRDEPYTTFGKVVANSDASINIGAFAKLLYDKHGIKIGRNRLFEWLRNNNYLIKSGRERNQPRQRYIEQGLFETTVALIKRTQGDVESVTTMITGKGQVEIAKQLMKEFKVAN